VVPPEPAEDELEIDDDLELDLDVDVDVDLSEVEPDADAGVESAAAPEPAVELADAASDTGIEGASLSTATTQQILEDLEEADFYLEQGLLDEAEGLFKRVLAVAPNHPRALVRLGELAASRGSDPSAAVATKAPAAPAAKARPRPAPAPEPQEEIVIEEPEALGDISIDEAVEESVPALAQPADEEVAAALELDGTAELSAPEPGEDTPYAPAASLPEVPKPVAPPAAKGAARTAAEKLAAAAAKIAADPIPAVAAKLTPASVAAAPAAPAISADDSGDYDLAAELSDAFDDPAERSASGSGSQDVDFETVFAAFKRGVSETLDEGDYEAHYDLGIAYKEMGLLDDAIAEFHIAMGNTARETECVHLIGLCSIDAGKPEMAVDPLERLLRKPGLVKEQTLVLRFDLGRAYAASGRRDAARSAFQAVIAQDPKFQDVASHLAALDAPPPAKAGGDGFESFDDMFDGISDGEEAADEEKREVAAGESFEDLFDGDGEAEEAAEPEEPMSAPAPPPAAKRRAEPEPELEPEPEAPPAPRETRRAPTPAPSQKRKKKISFL
jgi:tetratricopeptide (TPR) repeat protein